MAAALEAVQSRHDVLDHLILLSDLPLNLLPLDLSVLVINSSKQPGETNRNKMTNLYLR